MKHFNWDLETKLFAPGLMAPPIVCLQWCGDEGPAEIVHARADRRRMVRLVGDALVDSSCQLVGHNVAYDLVCMAAEEPDLLPDMFRAYEQDRVSDTMLRQKLADISRGRYRTRQYNLGDCADIHDFPETVDKADLWRLRYWELAGIPLNLWPADAIAYALRDPLATRHVHQSQSRRYDRALLCDEYNQARKFFALRLMEVWGIRTDQRGVESLRIGAEQEIMNVRDLLVEYELVRKDGTRNMKNVRERVKAAYAAQGRDYPRPKQQKDKATGKLKPLSLNPACDNDACMQADDFVLEQYATYSQMTKVLAADVPMLASGLKHPIHTHFDIVESGRTSSASPNIQNPRRMAGVRECFVPRDGRVFIDSDQSALELRTVAQVCKRLVGFSKLADVLNAGRDPHTALAAVMLNQSYEWVLDHIYEPEVNERRTGAKGMNFGFPGGLGAKSFPAFAWRAYHFRITEEEVAQRKEEWLAAYPEFRPYHRFIGESYERGVTHLFTNRLRGRVTFTSAANSYFQGLGADVCGGSLWAVSRACYCDRGSALYGARPVNFMHDSILTEVDPDQAHEALQAQERLMIEGGAPFLPDVPPTVDGKSMTRWSKDAARIVFDGRVYPWAPLARGETIDDYARRIGVPSSAKGLDKSYAAQVKTFGKSDAQRAEQAKKAEEFFARLAEKEDEQENEAA